MKASQFHDFAVHGKLRKEPMFRITPRQVYIYLRSHDQDVLEWLELHCNWDFSRHYFIILTSNLNMKIIFIHVENNYQMKASMYWIVFHKS